MKTTEKVLVKLINYRTRTVCEGHKKYCSKKTNSEFIM